MLQTCFILLALRLSTAYDNIARGKKVTVYANSIVTDTNILTDGNNMTTCEHFESSNLHLRIDLGKNFSIKSSVFTFKGNFSGNGRIYYGDSHSWPFYVHKSYATDIPQIIDSDVQLIGEYINLHLWARGRSSELEVCDINVYGCETDHFGSDCQPCIKNDNCEICDVNNGECYVCRNGYTGPNCSMGTDNVALKKQSYLYYLELPYYVYQPSHLLVDGDNTQSSCIDFESYLNESIFMYFGLRNTYNIKGVRFHFFHEGTAGILFNYTVGHWSSSRHSGIEMVSAGSTELFIPYPYAAKPHFYILFSVLADELSEMGNNPFLLCEVEIIGCPANRPCRPCPVHCDQCNAIDGSCVCQAGYKGENCTEECSNNTYGVNCVYNCGHCFNYRCDHVTGDCSLGCDRGWATSKCNIACQPGFYGKNCGQRCSENCNVTNRCNRFAGECGRGCKRGWKMPTCQEECDGGMYGAGCTQKCGSCLDNKQCHHVNGTCLNGCSSGYQGGHCKENCPSGHFGINCENSCTVYCGSNSSCDQTTGICKSGCKEGWSGPLCGTEELSSRGTSCTDDNTAIIISIVVSIFIVLIGSVINFLMWKRNQPEYVKKGENCKSETRSAHNSDIPSGSNRVGSPYAELGDLDKPNTYEELHHYTDSAGKV